MTTDLLQRELGTLTRKIQESAERLLLMAPSGTSGSIMKLNATRRADYLARNCAKALPAFARRATARALRHPSLQQAAAYPGEAE